jgi:20S proteasome subunit alpha 2
VGRRPPRSSRMPGALTSFVPTKLLDTSHRPALTRFPHHLVPCFFHTHPLLWLTDTPSRSLPSRPGKPLVPTGILLQLANLVTAVSWCRSVSFLESRSPGTWMRSHVLTLATEYALNAVNQGVTSLGIKGVSRPPTSFAADTDIEGTATNGIVLATEKKSSSSLIDAASQSKVNLITPNIGMVYSGMGPDYRILVDRARKVSHTGYKRIYNEYPPTRILVQDVARVMQEATQSGGVRPYGVSLLIAGWDDGIEPEQEGKEDPDEPEAEKKAKGKTGGILKGGPSLYQVDPSGSYYPWKATAIGKSATSAKTFLEKRYTEGLELEDAIHIALLTLKETIEGEMNGDTVELGMSMLSRPPGLRCRQLTLPQVSLDLPKIDC